MMYCLKLHRQPEEGLSIPELTTSRVVLLLVKPHLTAAEEPPSGRICGFGFSCLGFSMYRGFNFSSTVPQTSTECHKAPF